ncbi:MULTISPECIES: hypothetical protein [unclassified Flavobacterium]|uniref:hypothetical protein n=1 Tax=unclassified Flavobacterium TaxID=196869 RepID=UPI00131464DC|nr:MULTISPECIES: hypothetical protein [unclassified Flavobacterium]
MKTKFFPKLLLIMLFSLSLYSCTTDEMPATENTTVTADNGMDGGPVIPPGPRP